MNNTRDILPLSNFDNDFEEAKNYKSKYETIISTLTNFMDNKPEKELYVQNDSNQNEVKDEVSDLKESSLNNKIQEIIYTKSGEYSDINPAPQILSKIQGDLKTHNIQQFIDKLWVENYTKFALNETLYSGLIYPLGVLKIGMSFTEQNQEKSSKLNFENINLAQFFPDMNAFSLDDCRYIFETVKTSVKSLWNTSLRDPILKYILKNGNTLMTGDTFDSTESFYLNNDNSTLYNQQITLIYYYYKNLEGKVNLEIYIESFINQDENQVENPEEEMLKEILPEMEESLEQQNVPYYLLYKKTDFFDEYPYAIFKYMSRPQSLFGVSLGEQLLPMQKQLYKLAGLLNNAVERAGKDIVIYDVSLKLDLSKMQDAMNKKQRNSWLSASKPGNSNSMINSLALVPHGALEAIQIYRGEMEAVSMMMERQAGLSEVSMGIEGKSATTGKGLSNLQQNSKVFENKVFINIENFLVQVYRKTIHWIPYLTNHNYTNEAGELKVLNTAINPNNYEVKLDLLSQSPSNKIKDSKILDMLIPLMSQHKNLSFANPGELLESYTNNTKFSGLIKKNLGDSILTSKDIDSKQHQDKLDTMTNQKLIDQKRDILVKALDVKSKEKIAQNKTKK